MRRRVHRRTFLRGATVATAGVASSLAFGCGDRGGETAVPSESASAPAATSTLTASPTATATPTESSDPSPTAPPPGWAKIAEDGPPPRRDHALVAGPGDTAYLFGGRAAGTALADLWRLDLPTGEWQEVSSPGPSARFGHNAVHDERNGRVLVFGGQRGSEFLDDLWAFDFAAERWWEISAAVRPAARYGAGSAFDPETGDWYVSHGFTFMGRFDDSWSIGGAATAWTDRTPAGDPPLERCLLRCGWSTATSSMVLFAGQSDVQPFHDDTWLLGRNGEWREASGGVRPPARNLYGSFFAPDGLHFAVFGGRGAAGDLGDAWVFNCEQETWSELPTEGAPAARSSHDIAWLPHHRTALLFGGTAGGTELRDTWTWRLPPTL